MLIALLTTYESKYGLIIFSTLLTALEGRASATVHIMQQEYCSETE